MIPPFSHEKKEVNERICATLDIWWNNVFFVDKNWETYLRGTNSEDIWPFHNVDFNRIKIVGWKLTFKYKIKWKEYVYYWWKKLWPYGEDLCYNHLASVEEEVLWNYVIKYVKEWNYYIDYWWKELWPHVFNIWEAWWKLRYNYKEGWKEYVYFWWTILWPYDRIYEIKNFWWKLIFSYLNYLEDYRKSGDYNKYKWIYNWWEVLWPYESLYWLDEIDNNLSYGYCTKWEDRESPNGEYHNHISWKCYIKNYEEELWSFDNLEEINLKEKWKYIKSYWNEDLKYLLVWTKQGEGKYIICRNKIIWWPFDWDIKDIYNIYWKLIFSFTDKWKDYLYYWWEKIWPYESIRSAIEINWELSYIYSIYNNNYHWNEYYCKHWEKIIWPYRYMSNLEEMLWEPTFQCSELPYTSNHYIYFWWKMLWPYRGIGSTTNIWWKLTFKYNEGWKEYVYYWWKVLWPYDHIKPKGYKFNKVNWKLLFSYENEENDYLYYWWEVLWPFYKRWDDVLEKDWKLIFTCENINTWNRDLYCWWKLLWVNATAYINLDTCEDTISYTTLDWEKKEIGPMNSIIFGKSKPRRERP